MASDAVEAGNLYGGPDPLVRPTELPLAGKRVLITAPRAYASALAARLIAAGARPLSVPGVVTCRLAPGSPEAAALDAALQTLLAGGFTHVTFTSRAGVEAVLERLALLQRSAVGDISLSAPGRSALLAAGGSALASTGVSVWALGADAQALMDAGVRDVRKPAVASTDGLVAALGSTGEAKGAKILCPVPHVVPPLVEPPVVPKFLEGLAGLGAVAARAPAYETAPGTATGGAAAELALLASGDVSAVIFTSAAEAQGLALAVGGPERLVAALKAGKVRLAAHGPTTARGVEAILSLPSGAIDIVPQDSGSFGATVAALEDAFRA